MVDIGLNKFSKFTSKIQNLEKQYAMDCTTSINNAKLLGLGTIPYSKHVLHKPLTKKLLKEYLIDQYTLDFPIEYARFLKIYNGLNLFRVKITTPKFSFAYGLFTIYGLPLTPPFARSKGEEQPFDVRIEGLSKHKNLPESWFKFAAYVNPNEIDIIYELFIDTTTNNVYSCERKKAEIIQQWSDLESCLCEIFDSYASIADEYFKE